MDFEGYIHQCVVKVLSPNGEVNGTGFWVLDGYCLTCFHVIQDYGANPSYVLVEYNRKKLKAAYRKDLSNPEEDIAVLEVKGESVKCVPLGKAVLDSEVRAYGYRKGFSESYIVTGKLRPGQHLSDPELKPVGKVYNLETSLPDKSSIVGMSGCPVFDSQRLIVIGLQYSEEEEGPSVSYVHPIEKVYKCWETLRVENEKISEVFNPTRLKILLEESGNLKNHLKIVEKEDVEESIEQKKKFHKIVSLRWDYIAAKADSERDLYWEIWPEIQKDKRGFLFYCILGEPLSGKSTLMRRLGYNLACEGKLVLHILEHQNHPSIWGHIKQFCKFLDKTIYVLVDDVFDDFQAFHALEKLAIDSNKEGLDIVVIGTSLQSQSAQRGLRDLHKEGILTLTKELKLTDRDKERIIKNIGLDPLSIEAQLFANLLGINQFYGFLAQIRALAEGVSFPSSEPLHAEMLEEQRLSLLRSRQPRLYEAYKYISFVHRFNLFAPLSLIQNLEDGRFYDILVLKGRTDWIFKSESQDTDNPTLKAAHWALAKIHWDIYLQFESPKHVLYNLISSARSGDPQEELFVLHLSRTCSEEDIYLIKRILADLSEEIKELQSALGVDHLLIWQRIYKKLDMEEDADRCLEEAKRRPPVNVADLRVLIPLLENEDPDKALMLIEKWIENHPDNGVLKVRYLTFLEDKFPDKLRKVIGKVSEWTNNPGDNWDAVAAYVQMAITHAPELIPDIASRLNEWLIENKDHQSAASIWIQYLRLIDALIDIQQNKSLIELPLQNCWNWLSQNAETRGYTLLAHFYSGMIEKYGTVAQKKETLEGFLAWLDYHPNVGHIWVACLNLIDSRWARRDDVMMVLDKIIPHIAEIDHPNTIAKSFTLLEKWGTREEKITIINKFYKWLEDPLNAGDTLARRNFISFVRKWGTDAQVDYVLNHGKGWLREHPDDQGIRVSCLILAEARRPEQIGIEIKECEQWLRDHPEANSVLDLVERMRRKRRS